MSLLQAAVLGLVQGATEFLPISSSAHLALFPWLLHWPDQGLTYDVALHWGTLLSLLTCFRRELFGLATKGVTDPASSERHLLTGIVLATVPAVLAGLILEDHAEALFRRPERIALTLIAFGILLAAADRMGRKHKGLGELDLKLCLAIGAAQALAIVPGVSRSGITITAALFIGLRRADAARFSFLLAVPITLGACILKLKDLSLPLIGPPFWLGIVLSALSGALAIRFFLGFLEKRDLSIFAIYRVALGALIIALSRAG